MTMSHYQNKENLLQVLRERGLLSDAYKPISGMLKRPVVAIIPAAGKGTRLDFDGPKVLFPIKGTPILKLIHDTIADLVSEFCLVINPRHSDQIKRFTEKNGLRISFAVQEEPTGMGDAVLCAEPIVGDKAGQCDYLIIWGDQATVSRETVLTCLLHHQHSDKSPPLTFPTCRMEKPYIHFERDKEDRIVALRQQREGDEMPAIGESDCGVFVVRGELLFEGLREHKKTVTTGKGTGEFNFLPFIIWLAKKGIVVDGLHIADVKETRGINTLEDLEFIIGD